MYGPLIALAILIATLTAEQLARIKKLNTELIWQALIWVIVAGVVGARLYHVVDYWDYYIQNPLQIVQIHKGGLGIFGAFIAGSIALIIFLKIKTQDVLDWLNVFAVVLPLGQAIGRWGNYFNKELYGRGPIPFFAAESFLNLILFCVLFVNFRKQSEKSLALYLIGYGIIRFLLEFWRQDSWRIDSINIAQIISTAFLITGNALLFLFNRRV